VGKGQQAARVELEKIKFEEMTCRTAVLKMAEMYAHFFCELCTWEYLPFFFVAEFIMFTIPSKTSHLIWK